MAVENCEICSKKPYFILNKEEFEEIVTDFNKQYHQAKLDRPKDYTARKEGSSTSLNGSPNLTNGFRPPFSSELRSSQFQIDLRKYLYCRCVNEEE